MRPRRLAPLLLLAACQGGSPPPLPEPPRPEPPPWGAEWTPPADWDRLPPASFEAALLEGMPEGTRTPLSKETLNELSLALDGMDARAVRAALILGRSCTGPAGNRLFARLAKRVEGPDRASDAADCTAAAALARFPRPERWWRIVRLAVGENPHPDLEVRVECAITSLQLGFDEVVPFLLQVLRIGTPAGEADERDFTPSDTTAWLRGRAAEALSARAGVPLTYHPDAPLASREAAALELERILAPPVQAALAADLPIE